MKALNKLVKQTQTELDEALHKHRQGEKSVGTPVQLKRFLDNLQNILEELESGRLSGKKFGMSRAIVDSWPFDSELGVKLIKIETAYQKLSRK